MVPSAGGDGPGGVCRTVVANGGFVTPWRRNTHESRSDVRERGAQSLKRPGTGELGARTRSMRQARIGRSLRPRVATKPQCFQFVRLYEHPQDGSSVPGHWVCPFASCHPYHLRIEFSRVKGQDATGMTASCRCYPRCASDAAFPNIYPAQSVRDVSCCTVQQSFSAFCVACMSMCL